MWNRSDCVLIQHATQDVAPMLHLTLSIHSAYCIKHKIDYWPVFGLTGEGDGKGGGWEKNRQIAKAFEAGYRYVVFLDLDTLILPTCPDLRQGIPPGAFGCVWHDMDWKALDPGGTANLYDHHNIGAIYVEKTPLTELFLQTWWEMDDGGHCWGNQHAFKLAKEKWDNFKPEGNIPATPAPVVTIDRNWNSVASHAGETPFVLAWHGQGNGPQRFAMMQAAIAEHYGGDSPPPVPSQAQIVQNEEESIWKAAIAAREEGIRLKGIGDVPGSKAKLEESSLRYKHLVAVNPHNTAAWSQLAVLETERGNHQASYDAFRWACSLDPNESQFWHGRGFTASFLGLDEEAYFANEVCLRLSPDMPTARWNKSNILLAMGRYEEGWKEYEWGNIARMRPVRTQKRPIEPLDPIMSGQFPEKNIIVWPEQGQGDTIMFLRFLPELKRRTGCKIWLEIPPQLLPLLKDSAGADDVYVTQGDSAVPLPWDEHTSLASLPWLLQLFDEDDYRSAPYIFPDAHKSACWKAEFAKEPTFNIGIAWKGSATHANNPHRSIVDEKGEPSELWAHMAGTAGEGVKWIPLDPERNPGIKNWTDTAAILSALDLVITCDTGVAHLAGAMGVPTWILLPLNNDWRWLRDRDTSHWYDSVRLFRQAKLDDWKPVFECVGNELARVLDSRYGPSPLLTPPASSLIQYAASIPAIVPKELVKRGKGR